MPEVALAPDVRILRNPQSGDLRSVPVASAMEEAAKSGEHFATLDEIHAYNTKEKYGIAGQTAQATGEKALRTATLGAVTGFGSDEENRARAEQLNYYHPALAFGAEAIGGLAPAAAAAATGGAAGLGAAGVATAEGVGFGLGSEASAAFEEQRDISAGNVALAGVGGLLMGHAIPSVIRRGAGLLAREPAQAAAAVAGEVGSNVAPQLEQESARRVAAVASDIPAGPTREAVMAGAADAHLEQAATTVGEVSERAPEALQKSDLSKSELKKLIAPDAPVQTEWATRMAQELREKTAGKLPIEPAPEPVRTSEITSRNWLKVGKDVNSSLGDAEAKALGVYAENGHIGVNRHLRGGTSGDTARDEYFSDLSQKVNAALDRQVELAHTVPGTVYRMINAGTHPELAPGESFVAKGIMSTSQLASGARTLGGEGEPLLLEIQQQSGVPLVKREKYTRYENAQPKVERTSAAEREILLRHGTEFDVIGYGPAKDLPGYGEVKTLRLREKPPALGQELSEAPVPESGERLSATAEPPAPAAEAPKPTTAPNIRRAANGARIAEIGAGNEGGSPLDLSDWQLDDFSAGKSRSKVHAERAQQSGDYSGVPNLSSFQRSLVDGIKENPDFVRTGRVSGDTGKFGSEPTFEVQPGSTVKMHNGKMRMIAARELGMPEIYGKIEVEGKTVYEGMIPVGKAKAAAPEAPSGIAAPPAAPPPEPPSYAGALKAASDSLLESKGALDTLTRARQALVELRAAGAPPEVLQSLADGVKDQSLWGRAGEAVEDFDRTAAPTPGKLGLEHREQIDALAAALENRAAARNKWSGAGGDTTARKLMADAQKLRGATSVADEVSAARAKVADVKPEPAPPAKAPEAPKATAHGVAADLLKDTAKEAAWHAVTHVANAVVPGAGFALRAGKSLWGKLADNGAGMVQAAARRLSQGSMPGAGAAAIAGASALEHFAGDFPTPAAAFSARKDMLVEMMRNPGVLPHAMSESFGDLPKENPKLFADLSARMARASAYVGQNMPVGISTSLAYPRGVPPSQSSLRDFALIWNAAMDPSTVLADVAKGSAAPAQIKALQAVDPDVYQSLLASVTSEIGQNYQQVPSQTKQWLDILFQGDGMAGPAYSWRAAEYITEGDQRQASAPKPPSNLPPPGEQQSPNAAGIEAIKSGVTNRGA